MRIDRRRLGQVLLAIGCGLLVLGAWSAAQYRLLDARAPFFSRPFGLAVARDGTLYVGANLSQVHAYDPEGAPLRGWSVPSAGGPFRLRLADDRLEVAPARTGELLVYDLAGNRISATPDPAAYERLGDDHDRRAETAGGLVYELAPEGLVRTAPAPAEVLVSTPPWPLSALGPRPAVPLFLLLVGGTLGPIAGVVLTAAPRRAREPGR